jgi:hypothetical protein
MDRESANGHRCAWQDADAVSCWNDGIGNGSRRVVMGGSWKREEAVGTIVIR